MDKNVMKGDTPKISVIIPVYNTQNYLERCLQSLLNQTFSDFELICVDDGSGDMSGAICDTYGEKDDRIRVFHIENAGAGNARNYGLSLVRGEWFAFVDSDDWVEPDFLRVLYEHAVKYNADVAACLFERSRVFTMNYDRLCEPVLVFETEAERMHNFICETLSMEGMSANKLYRASCLKAVHFHRKLRVNEDCLYTYEVMKRCQRAVLVPVKMYHWFYRKESLSHWKYGKADFAAPDVFLTLMDLTEELRDEEIERTLQKNYIYAIVALLIFSCYTEGEAQVRDAISRCKQWRSQVWSMLEWKEKIKFIAVVDFSWGRTVCRYMKRIWKNK